jgi:hypothetical protein
MILAAEFQVEPSALIQGALPGGLPLEGTEHTNTCPTAGPDVEILPSPNGIFEGSTAEDPLSEQADTARLNTSNKHFKRSGIDWKIRMTPPNCYNDKIHSN